MAAKVQNATMRGSFLSVKAGKGAVQAGQEKVGKAGSKGEREAARCRGRRG